LKGKRHISAVRVIAARKPATHAQLVSGEPALA
jgi:hypothetical protein